MKEKIAINNLCIFTRSALIRTYLQVLNSCVCLYFYYIDSIMKASGLEPETLSLKGRHSTDRVLLPYFSFIYLDI